MKKILTLAIAFALTLSFVPSAMVFAETAGVSASSTVQDEYPEPVKISDEELDEVLNSDLTLFSEDEAPDWMNNTNLPTYQYLLNNSYDKYANIYKKVYNTAYNYGVSASPRYLQFTSSEDPSVKFKFVLVDISEEFNVTEVMSAGILDPDSGNQIYMDIYDITKNLFYENPQFYFQRGARQLFVSDDRVCIGFALEEDYCTGSSVAKQNDIITAAVKEYDEAVKNTDNSNYLIEKAVHDKIILDNDYAFEDEETLTPSDERFAHSIIGILDPQYDGAVCEGYASAMLFFMNRYKVPCFYIGGLADSERHAWNVVLLDDGEYHCVDCTWDDSYYIEGTKRVRILGYKYFNMPYTNFYTDGQRDNSSLSLTQMIPQLSENTNFYNKDYLTKEYYQLSYTTTANNIRIYPAPSVTYKKTRVYSTASDMTLIPLISNESYTGDFTETANFYRIVKSGGDFVKVGENTGSIVLARNASNTFFAYGTGDGSLSFLTNTGVKLSFKAGFKDGKLEIYADGKDALIAEKEASEYTQTISLNIPADTHKITVKYTGGSLIQINAVVAHPFADIDNNGKVNILDAIALASAPYPETTSNYADYTIYDVDGNNVIDDMDIKAILKAAISAL